MFTPPMATTLTALMSPIAMNPIAFRTLTETGPIAFQRPATSGYKKDERPGFLPGRSLASNMDVPTALSAPLYEPLHPARVCTGTTAHTGAGVWTVDVLCCAHHGVLLPDWLGG